jgi:arsenate reductase (thioredoxin)
MRPNSISSLPFVTTRRKKSAHCGPVQPMTAHWGVPDPAAVQGKEQIDKAFRDAFFMLDRRISLFLSLPLTSLDSLAIKKEIENIGHQ